MPDTDEKSPALAAILSLLIWGLGQIYVGKSIAKGAILIIGDIAFCIIAFFLLFIPMSCIIISIIGVLLTIFIMIDAYKEAVEHNKNIESKKSARHCPQCGRNIPEDAKMCPYCMKEFKTYF